MIETKEKTSKQIDEMFQQNLNIIVNKKSNKMFELWNILNLI